MRIIEYSLLLHISVFDLDHNSERIPKETVCCIPVMVTLFQVIKKKGVFKLYQLMGNFFFLKAPGKVGKQRKPSNDTQASVKNKNDIQHIMVTRRCSPDCFILPFLYNYLERPKIVISPSYL